MFNLIVTFCSECGEKIDLNVVKREVLTFRKGMCIKCFLKSKKPNYCIHKDECRYFREVFCVYGDVNGWAECMTKEGEQRCFTPNITVKEKI